MNVAREIERINQRELELNISETASWHAEYRHSAYIFIGGLDYELTEGDLLAVFSQFGECVDLHLVRDQTSGRSLGFAFLAFEDQRSTVLAIDNMNGYQLLGRTLRVDHADKFRRPKGEKKEAAKPGEINFSPEDDEEYDQRRKRIWDYEKYGTLEPVRKVAALAVGEVPAFDGEIGAPSTAPAAADSKQDTQHADRVMRLLEERRRARRERPPSPTQQQTQRRRRSRSRSRSRDRKH